MSSRQARRRRAPAQPGVGRGGWHERVRRVRVLAGL